MKLLIVTPYFYPKIGGLENYAWHISKGLKETYDWDIVVVTSNHSGKKYREETIDGIKIYRLPYWLKISNTPINLGWIIDLVRIISKERPDIINGHTPVPFITDLAAVVSSFYKIQFILTYHNDLMKGTILDILSKCYFATLGKLTFIISKKIIATSKYYADNSIFIRSYKKKIEIVPPGVDIKLFDSVEVDSKMKQKYLNKKVVLFVGQLDDTHKHKGLEYLIKSMALVTRKNKNVKLVIIGKGNMIEDYRKKAHGIDVEFHNNVDDTELVQFYKASDIVVLPSTSNSEGFGMVLIEAGASKKPVIGSKIGGIPYVIDDKKTGLLTEAKNISALSENIIILLKDNKLAQRMGENGYIKVKNEFTWNTQILKTHELFTTK